jgi:hypothetical protein
MGAGGSFPLDIKQPGRETDILLTPMLRVRGVVPPLLPYEKIKLHHFAFHSILYLVHY